MRPPVHVASARQHSGEPPSGSVQTAAENDRLRGPDRAGLDGEIAGLAGQSTQALLVPGGHCITPDRPWASVAI
jgi:hypothetical protein